MKLIRKNIFIFKYFLAQPMPTQMKQVEIQIPSQAAIGKLTERHKNILFKLEGIYLYCDIGLFLDFSK